MERRAIADHVQRRLIRACRTCSAATLEARVTAIQERIHRNRPSMRQRQAVRAAAAPQEPLGLAFTRAELRHMADLFERANDPTSAAIGRKARVMLQRAGNPQKPAVSDGRKG